MCKVFCINLSNKIVCRQQVLSCFRKHESVFNSQILKGKPFLQIILMSLVKSIRDYHPMFFQLIFPSNINKLILLIFKHEGPTKFHEGHAVQFFLNSDELIATKHKKFFVTSQKYIYIYIFYFLLKSVIQITAYFY